MNGFDAVGMSVVSTDELEQIDGGNPLLIGGLIGIGATVGGALVTKAIMEGGGGGEVLPGFNNFVAAHIVLGAASAGRPK